MLREARLVALRLKAAAEFMETFEHLGNVGLGVWHWGLEVGGDIVGVVSYGTPCSSCVEVVQYRGHTPTPQAD